MGIFVSATDAFTVGGGGIMLAIASHEDLKAAQKDLQEAKDLSELKAAFKKWRGKYL